MKRIIQAVFKRGMGYLFDWKFSGETRWLVQGDNLLFYLVDNNAWLFM
jgi:hypothetical protein